MKAIILFSTCDGQTQEIASYIASQVKEVMGCDVMDIQQANNLNWSAYDRILIGASIRYGHFHPAVNKFVAASLEELQQRISGFFSVSLTARKPEKRTPCTNPYTYKFLMHTPWQPECSAVFAGALRYPAYRWLDRIMIQFIMRLTGGETDTTKEVEYTDWDQVKCFAQKFACLPTKMQ